MWVQKSGIKQAKTAASIDRLTTIEVEFVNLLGVVKKFHSNFKIVDFLLNLVHPRDCCLVLSYFCVLLIYIPTKFINLG